MGRAVKKNLDRPDEHLTLGWLTADVVQLGDASIARTAMSPGARCSLNNNGGGSCQANHAGFVLSGRMGVETDDGLQLEFGPNDVFDVGPGHDGWVVGDEPLVFVNWNGFRTWMPDASVTERVLLTLLFTDIVGSTELASSLGDARWKAKLDQHNAGVRAVLDRFHGREVGTTGDGFFAAFDGPGRAVQAAFAIRAMATGIGLEIRQGIHTGEVELAGAEIRGVGVHEAARVSAAAGAGQVLVSATTRAFVSGSGATFESRGERELKGLDGPRELFEAIEPSLTTATA
jgi:class 3 adenylate cyclase